MLHFALLGIFHKNKNIILTQDLTGWAGSHPVWGHDIDDAHPSGSPQITVISRNPESYTLWICVLNSQQSKSSSQFYESRLLSEQVLEQT